MPTMTTTSAANHGNEDAHMSFSDPPTKPNNSPDSNDATMKSQNTFSIKIEFKTTSQAFPAPEIHRKIILAIESQFPTTKINTNVNPNTSITANKHTNDYFLRNFNYPSFSRTKFSLVCVAHNIMTTASFNEIHEAAKKLLSQNKAFLRINRWKCNELNVVNIGWLYGAHPHAHSRNRISETINNFCRDHNKAIPQLEIFAKPISSSSSPRRRITTTAIQFACLKDTSADVKSILQECFSDSNIYLPGKFIPSDLSYKQGQTVYSQYIQHQNKYLSNHRSISVTGVQSKCLTQTFNHNNRTTTPVQEVQSSKLIDWISPTNRTTSEGRFLFSTDKDRYQEAIKWIDQTFLPMIKQVSSTTSPAQSHSSIPIRIGTSPKQDKYSESLASSINTITATSYVRPPNAWNKPISIIASSTPQTSVSRMTVSSDQTTLIERMEKQISSLTKTVQELQTKLEASQQAQNESINVAVEKAFNTHNSKLEEQYQNMIQSVNNHWKQVTASLPALLNASNSNCNHTPSPSPPMTPPRKSDEKRSRDIHQSGSNRARKPRRYSSGGLDSIQRSITHFLSNPTDTDPNTSQHDSSETTMKDD